MICQICKQPIRKIAADINKPDSQACYIHITGTYQCPESRSEYDLATYDPEERVPISADAPDDYNI